MSARYGYCPKCGAKGEFRERCINGNDTCINGHVYPSKEALNNPYTLNSYKNLILGWIVRHQILLFQESIDEFATALKEKVDKIVGSDDDFDIDEATSQITCTVTACVEKRKLILDKSSIRDLAEDVAYAAKDYGH